MLKQRFLLIACVALLVSLALPMQAAVQMPTPPAVVQRDRTSEADHLFQQAVEQYEANQWDAAIDLWQQALLLYQQRDNVPRQLATLHRLSAVYLQVGESQQAIAHAQGALTLAQQLNDEMAAVQALGNLGIAYRTVGDYIQAIDSFHQALTIVQTPESLSLSETARDQLHAQLLLNLGNVHEALGEYEQAIALYRESLALFSALNRASDMATVLGNLGVIETTLGHYDEAVQYYEQSLQIAQAMDDPIRIGYIFNNLGTVYHAQQQLEQAIVHYQQSLAIAQTHQQPMLEGEVLTNLGLAYDDLADYERAINYHQQSLAIAHATGNRRAEAIALNNWGHALFNAGDLPQAEAQIRAAVTVLDSLRPGLEDAANVSLFDTQALTYNLLQQVLVAQDKFEEALEVAEQGRSRAFVSLLNQRLQASPASDQTLPPESKGLAIEQIRHIAQAQNATLVEYTIVPADSFKAQGKLRGQAAKIFIWVVQPTGNLVFRQVDLEAEAIAAEDLTFTELVVTARQRLRGGGGAAVETTQSPPEIEAIFQPGDRVRRYDEPLTWRPYTIESIDGEAETVTLSHPEFVLPYPVPIAEIYLAEDFRPRQRSLQTLYDALIAPIADDLPTNPDDRVIFIPHEQLFVIPFSALQDAEGRYLIEQHTLLTAPAIEVLALTQKRHAQINLPEPPSAEGLIVGNPSPMPRSLASLPHAEAEAEAIAQLLQTNAITGASATETAIKQRLADAPLIHLATHGFFNETHPLQGAIALAPSTTEDDGFLTAAEILDFPLKAELVVLSACDTGRGRITGDGVIGLSRSFMAAGASRVLVSLWQVPDEATAQLMVEFYRYRQQLDDAQALRRSMLAAMQTQPSPYNWAAFTLVGAIPSD
ncbi:CHAT domain-containing protein [Vacuolonema iberomarrocanum]|uniref:CHAT domain-containing protein n=1 Tax=Vacuolonema iberomarrocanum TaxID=3454632 RepID=UPI001A0F8771|nr:CHAT domain-containing protein [filamentous cyanobacterium LEGE 07170]